MTRRTYFPPIRAFLFDIDGLLINTEDIYTKCHNIVLSSYSAGPMTWDIKSQIQGLPAYEAAERILIWFDLEDYVTPEEFMAKMRSVERVEFRRCQPLPGAARLLNDLMSLNRGRQKLYTALVTSCSEASFKLKTAHLSEMFSIFKPELRIFGDDPRIPRGRGKPQPDIYRIAMNDINLLMRNTDAPLRTEECLAFEGSVQGVFAARRAGMRIVWVPHPGLANYYRGRESIVILGPEDHPRRFPFDERDIDGSWCELRDSLVNFSFREYGIRIESC